MSKTIVILLGLSALVYGSLQGSDCGTSIYFTSTSLDVSPFPLTLGQPSALTLTGTSITANTLQAWDVYWYSNGQIVDSFSIPLSTSLSPNQVASIYASINIPPNARSGLNTIRLLLQTTQSYYISCWTFNTYF